MKRALLRLLVVLGVLHVVDAMVWAWLWRHRRAVVRALGQALREEFSPAAGEGAAGPSLFSAAPRGMRNAGRR